jgi:uncharacterized protein YwgA
MDESVRRSIMLDLVHRLESQGPRVTMTSLQKLSYFLQEVLKVPLGLRFVMHYYGPYSFDLAHSISAMGAIGTIRVLRDPDGYGYWVHPADTDDTREMLDESKKERAGYAGALEKVASNLGGLQPWELELLSTCDFVRRLLRANNRPVDDETVTREVHSLKPRFSEEQISGKLSKLDKIVAYLRSSTPSP